MLAKKMGTVIDGLITAESTESTVMLPVRFFRKVLGIHIIGWKHRSKNGL